MSAPHDSADDLSELYQEVILDHNRNPRNFRVPPGANHHAEGDNPLCGDHYTVFLKLDQDVILEAGFQGAGCAISKASASLMTEQIKGKTVAEAKKLFTDFQSLVTTGQGNDDELGSLAAMGGVHKFPMRVKCAVLSWRAMLASLEGAPKTTTEESS